MNVLLIQVRDDERAELQERACFVDASGLPADAFGWRNVVSEPEPEWNDVADFDVLMIGGAGAHSAIEDYDFTPALSAIVRRWVEADRPFFGSCWGHHFLARLFGGDLIRDPSCSEIGTFDIHLTEAGMRDPLLAGVRSPFAAQLGHHDTVATLPAGFVELGRSARCRNQILRREGTLVYGTQFHCELDEERIRERLIIYQERYLEGLPVESISLRPSPIPPRLLHRFLELCAEHVAGNQSSRTGGMTGRPHDSLGESEIGVTSRLSGRTLREAQTTLLPEANLIVLTHPDERLLGRRYRLAPGATMEIGRSDSCEIAMTGVASISRRHARLSFDAGEVVLQDLDSTNGTYVKDRRVDGATTLANGDRFQVGVVHFKLLRERDPEHAYHRAIDHLVSHDGLTEVYNKRKFEEESEREFVRARRYERPLSLVLIDLDHFKAINDRHGHLCGDFVLKRVARVCREELRPEQVLARVGGEEFAVLCPETATVGALQLAERLRSRVAEHAFDFSGVDVAVRCSFGVAERQPDMATFESLFAAADEALYRSKAAGRDRVSVAG